MNARLAIAVLIAASLMGVPGCGTPHVVTEPAASITRLPPMTPWPRYELRDGRFVPVPETLKGQICQLGTSCLTMDPRPFEPCLLSTKRCNEKAAEPMLVGPPEWIIPAPQAVAR
jgi:hypothetical protein